MKNPRENPRPAAKSFLRAAVVGSSLVASAYAESFRAAQPVWPEGRDKEKNLSVGFRAVVENPKSGDFVLRVTASTLYRAFLNGEFLGYGPARGPHGWFRIDTWDLSDSAKPGRNLVAIEVAGYNINSYSLLDQPAFLQAEVVADGKVLAATRGHEPGFTAAILPERVQKVQRYSPQRTFCEAYRLKSDSHLWRSEESAPFSPVRVQVLSPGKHLDRGVPYPSFSVKPPARRIAEGRIKIDANPKRSAADDTLKGVGPQNKGYEESELEVVLSRDLDGLVTASSEPVDRAWGTSETLTPSKDTFQLLDFGVNRTGFPGATITCTAPCRVYFVFDELLTNGDINFARLGTVNGIRFDLEPGTHAVESFEPYTMRYLKIVATEGDCAILNIHLREYANDDCWRASFSSGDPRLNQVFEAARQTFRQNAVDIFMDCPSRERAGWLCDSFFTARACLDLCGNTAVERNFLENFLLPERFEHIQEGMLPMCYPADHYNHFYIPNWALWFVMQLAEYRARGGEAELVQRLRPRVLALFDYLAKSRNKDGLLEKLGGWIFVEWSDANKFTQDVNYPTNMLYAGALAAAGRMYNRPDLTADAQRIRETIRRQSFDGQFFVDNAVRKGGKLERTQNRSEIGQYYAFFFDVATSETHPALLRTLLDEFGPRRLETKALADIVFPNAFPGYVLRLELLARAGRTQQLVDEALTYYLPQAKLTGTLWEHGNPVGGSCNHGFASHVAYVFYRDVLGVQQIDRAKTIVRVRIPNLALERCEGTVPIGKDALRLAWWKQGGKVHYRATAPKGFQLQLENASGLELIRDAE